MKNKKETIINFIQKLIIILITIISLLSLSIFSYHLLRLNIIPTKYLFIGYSIIIISLLFVFMIIYIKKNKILKAIGILILAISSLGFNYVTENIVKTKDFLNNIIVKEYNTINFSIIVKKDSSYNQLNDLKNKTIAYLDNEYTNEITKELSNKIAYESYITTEFGILPDLLASQEVAAIILEDSYYSLIKDEIEDFDQSTKVIDTIKIQEKSHIEEENKIEISKEPFILYISGIDQYGNINNTRGRSDVNQLVVVNPKTNHILLVNTPRDYYVELSGTTGLKDKLTHAGIYGISRSISTLEEFYNIDISYYLRVNFNSLIKVIDAIDGIDIYSDKSFQAYTNKNVYVNEGWNRFNGTEALAYSRERYAYLTGDNHRGANQQQVITAIINKVTNSKVLISKYKSILASLEGSIETDMPEDIITSFIKYQLSEMPSWTIESIAVTGTGKSDYTYSMGTNYLLYVMEPNMNSVNQAITKINEVLYEN